MSLWIVVGLLGQLSGDAGTPAAPVAPTWSPVLDVVGEYAVRAPKDVRTFNGFSVPRAQAGLGVEWRGAEGRLVLEGVHATQGGALVGVAGDSAVARLREAWVGYRWRFLKAQVGLTPALLLSELDAEWRHRALGPGSLEGFRLLPPTDFGASLRAELPARLGWVGAAVTNGEGYSSRELNGGKNVELTASVRPLPGGRLWPLALVASASFGSAGQPEIPTARFGGGLLWSGPRLGAAVMGYGFRGYLSDSARRGYLVEGNARGALFGRLLLAARLQYLRRDVTENDAQLEALGAVGVRAEPLEAFVVVAHTRLFGVAASALPGLAGTEVRLAVGLRWPDPHP